MIKIFVLLSYILWQVLVLSPSLEPLYNNLMLLHLQEPSFSLIYFNIKSIEFNDCTIILSKLCSFSILFEFSIKFFNLFICSHNFSFSCFKSDISFLYLNSNLELFSFNCLIFSFNSFISDSCFFFSFLAFSYELCIKFLIV